MEVLIYPLHISDKYMVLTCLFFYKMVKYSEEIPGLSHQSAVPMVVVRVALCIIVIIIKRWYKHLVVSAYMTHHTCVIKTSGTIFDISTL